MKAKIISTRSMPIGSSSNMDGGGGNGGSTRGRSNNEAVRQSSTRMDSTLKWLEVKDLLLFACVRGL